MAYGTVKVDTIIFDQGGADQNVTVSGIYRAITSGVTVSGTIAGAVLIGTTTVSGTTVTGTTANFASGVFTTQVSGATVTGTQSSFTSGNFVTLSGATATFTSGVIASGTAAAPSLSIVGDGNTGIYSPGADQLAVATNGTARLVIDANGTVTCTSAQPTDGSIRISNTTTRAPSNKYGIRFADSASETNAAIYAEQASSGNNASALVFGTNNGTGGGVLTSATERLRITAAGLVGIGTSSPATALQVVGTATFGNGVGGRLQATTDSSLGYIDSLNNTSTEWQPLIQRGTEIQFHTNTAGVTPVEKVRITSAGLVGIGTTSPTQLLDISAASSSARIISTTGTNFAFLNFNNTAGNAYVGLENSTGSNFSSGTGAYSLCLAHQGAYPICFATNNLERARIDSSGRLLVGTSSSRGASCLGLIEGVDGGSTKPGLEIISNYTSATADGEPIIALIRSGSTAIGSNVVVANGNKLGQIYFRGTDGTGIVDAASIAAFVDGTPGANDMPGRLVFSTTADGASATTERMRITSDGYMRLASGTGGLQFNGDTAAVNALDDYEEGTWTPSDASGAGLSFTDVSAFYTKIGRFVICQFSLDYPSNANGAGANIGGLPFTCNFNGGGFSMYTTSSVGSIAARNQAPSNIMILTYGNDQDVAIANSALSLSQIQITFMYQFGV